MRPQNLMTDLPPPTAEELLQVLHRSPHVRIERIVSQGHCSDADFWYDQDEHEWVAVLEGEARLLFDTEQEIHLCRGDYILIRAHQRHRVTWTKPDEPTLTLLDHPFPFPFSSA